jgi:phosphate starvation-inducible PhoH-like protein
MNENKENLKEPAVKFKRIRKGPITFNIKLTDEQKQAKALALENIITVFTGKPGTSKSTLVCNVALDLLIKGVLDKIIVTRPVVDVSKSMGFLPGDAFDFKEGKMAPYISPLLETMYKLRNQKEINEMIAKDLIQILPINFVRGRNFENCVVIVDEAQNLTYEELKALTTRICFNSKMLFTSDLNQVDLFDKTSSAGRFFDKIRNIKDVVVVELLENFRHPLAITIMEEIDKHVYNEKALKEYNRIIKGEIEK